MTTPRFPFWTAKAIAALLGGLCLLATGAAAASQASILLYERTLMGRADARCHLFSPKIAGALAAAAAQSRSAALRAGDDPAAVAATAGRASARADAVACDNPDLQRAANRVRKAFDGYAALRTLSFPGLVASWSADRQPWPLVVNGAAVPGPRWRLWQTSPGTGGALTVGLATGEGAGSTFLALTQAPDAAGAYASRLVLRDPAKAPQPFIDPRRPGLAGRTPPRMFTRAFLASDLGPAPLSLIPPGGARRGVLARFPPEAAQALAALDPREAVTVEFLFPSTNGERVEAAAVEVGDFAAGEAFLVAGR
jgi:hypothetical protein